MKVKEIIENELKYQQQQLKLIPSENYVSKGVLNAVGSVMINKYAEGQAFKRYYQGNKNMDMLEELCKNLALQTFNLDPDKWAVNVQAVTGSVANLSVYNAILNPQDKILAMSLFHGGHLSHGWKLPNGKKISFSSKVFNSSFYMVSPKDYRFDYDQIEKQAQEEKPALIISGGTAYPRQIDFKRLSEIAKSVGAKYLADIAHEAGLVANGQYDSPFEYADFVTMTTRKTLRGPIGALVFCRKEYEDAIDSSIFPGLQGGPMMNSIAGIATALEEAQTKDFETYIKQVRKNADTLAASLVKRGFNVITGGTDSHLILIDITNKQPNGYVAAEILEAVDIILNKNTIPFDPGSPWRPSGIRLGTPSVTTRGMKEAEMEVIAELIEKTLKEFTADGDIKKFQLKKEINKNRHIFEIKKEVNDLTQKFPIYND
ncbi:serine hydroxymethyltransferase [Candidatus Dojkabacteria bacterium]|nr:serine hydroxymethyltransferase [Candidatus Dojkabacteria bacterium]